MRKFVDPKYWTKEEDQIILDNIDLSASKIAKMLGGRSTVAVKFRRQELRRREEKSRVWVDPSTLRGTLEESIFSSLRSRRRKLRQLEKDE